VHGAVQESRRCGSNFLQLELLVVLTVKYGVVSHVLLELPTTGLFLCFFAFSLFRFFAFSLSGRLWRGWDEVKTATAGGNNNNNHHPTAVRQTEQHRVLPPPLGLPILYFSPLPVCCLWCLLWFAAQKTRR
jgi:hypothetical protein